MRLSGGYASRYIVYEGEVEYLERDYLMVDPADGEVTLLYDLLDIQEAYEMNMCIHGEFDAKELKAIKCIPEYIGEIKNGLYSGKGKVYSESGNLSQEGKFEKGDFVEGKTYEGS